MPRIQRYGFQPVISDTHIFLEYVHIDVHIALLYNIDEANERS